jgi:hypothetical protein
MSQRTRLLVIFVVTLFVIGVAIGYMVGRARHWHQQGWTGVSYIFGPAAAQEANLMGLAPGQVMLTASGSPADGKLRFRDEIVSIGGIPRGDLKRLAVLNAQLRRGSTVVYQVRRGNTMMNIPLRFESPLRSSFVIVRHVIALIVGLAFVATALVIVTRAPNDSRATVFFALALISAVAILVSAATVYEQSNARGIIASPGQILNTLYVAGLLGMFYPPLILHLALIFPRRRPILEKYPVLIRWIYAVALIAVLTLAFAAFILSLFDWQNLNASEERLKLLLRPSRYMFIVIGVGLALHILWVARREGAKAAIARRPIRSTLGAFSLLMALRRGVALISKPAGIVFGIVVSILPMIVLATFPILALIALVRSHREANAEEKRQVAWPLWGLLITVVVRILSAALGLALTAWVTLQNLDMIAWRGVVEALHVVPTIITLAIPISFAVAILKYRLMNIDLIIRKTVVYAILSGAILVLYLALVGGLGTVLVNVAGLRNQTMVIASTLVVAALFVPLRNRLQMLVDRNLFRNKYQYAEALTAISTPTTFSRRFRRSSSARCRTARW